MGNYARLYHTRQRSSWRCRPGCLKPLVFFLDTVARGGGFLLACDGGQTQYIFEKPKNILNLGYF